MKFQNFSHNTTQTMNFAQAIHLSDNLDDQIFRIIRIFV